MIEFLTTAAVAFVTFLGMAKLALYLSFDRPNKLRGKTVLLKDAAVNYPGHMAFASKGGEYFHGCRVARFKSVQDLNDFFLPGNAGALKLVADLVPMRDDSILCVFTNKLTDEELEDLDEWNRNQHEYFQAKRNKRMLDKAAKEEEKLKEDAESKRLAEVGRKYEARTKHLKALPAASLERKTGEKDLNSGNID